MKLWLHAALAGLLILSTAAAGEVFKAKTLLADRQGQADYASVVPDEFGDWKLVPSIRLVTPADDDSLAKQIYAQMVGRAYRDKAGNTVMLLIAYGPRQSDRLQLHRPEICYVAEGFRVTRPEATQLDGVNGLGPLKVSRLVAQREGRTERITYWMRIGDDVVSTLLGRQAVKLRYGLQGVIPDGVLFRISTINMEPAASDQVQAAFLRDLFGAMKNENIVHLLGSQTLKATQTRQSQKNAALQPASTGRGAAE